MADSDSKIPAKIDGNTLAAMCLNRAGVDRMFGVVGIPVTYLANRAVALGIRFIAFHNEQSAGYAASAYGYLTGKPGILLTVSGPGCVHGLAGLSNAATNAWPMVLISGSCDQKDFGRGDFQELDQIADVAPFSKLSIKATDITKIPSSVLQVLDRCGSGRPGGCYLDLPSDVLRQTITKEEAEKFWLLIGEIFSSKDEGNEEGKETKSKGDQAKDLLAKYGGAYLATSITLSLISFALCYALINAGVDVAALLQKIGITSNENGEKVGTFALAYAAHKAASPIRFPPTVALTPIVASWIGKKVDKEQ